MVAIHRRAVVGAPFAMLALAGGRAAGQAPVAATRLVAGFAPGSLSDAIARQVAGGLRAAGYAASVEVENHPGDEGRRAVESMRGAASDGSAIVQASASTLAIHPHTRRTPPGDPAAGLAPVSLGCTADFGFCVGPAVPESVTTVPAFLTWCKADPARAQYGSPGAASASRFVGALLGRAGGVELRHVAHPGIAAAIEAVVAGKVPAASGLLGDFVEPAAAGKLRVLGTSGAERSRFVPEVATYAEQGYEDIVLGEWFGFFVPAATPAPAIERANVALRAALARESVREELLVLGVEPTPSTPQELAVLLKDSDVRWQAIVRTVGYRPDP